MLGEFVSRPDTRREGEVRIYNKRVGRTTHVAAWDGMAAQMVAKNPNRRVRYIDDVPG